MTVSPKARLGNPTANGTGSTKGNYSPYVDAFGNTGPLLYCEVAVDVDSFNGIRTFGSYSQLSRVLQFLQNFLAWSIVVRPPLPICTQKVVIDELLCRA